VQATEAAIGATSLFAHLRPDELGKIARVFEIIQLEPGVALSFAEQREQARLVLVLSGSIDAMVEDPAGEAHIHMAPGDRYGEASLISENFRRVELRARLTSEIAVLNRAGLDRILELYPAVALPLAAELATELRTRNDQVRQIAELRLSGHRHKQVESSVSRLRDVIALRSAAVRRPNTRGLFRRFVVAQGREPPFWMLLGFVVGLTGARILVHLILKYKLEKQLFALVQGPDVNPMHIHHFNYGLILVAITGLLALSPTSRRSLRSLSMAFGFGCGLIFDEFALFWNLNPDYSQGLSLISAAIAFIVLVQLVYFRRFWVAVGTRAVRRIRGE